MTFPSGLYTLRAGPVVGLGGLYATGNGDNKDVTVAPQIPPPVEHQVWFIKDVNPEKRLYTITLYTGPESTLGEHWIPKGGEAFPEDPIITSAKTYEWIIAYDHAHGVPEGAITIQATNARPGVDYYAGTNDKKQVLIIPVPVVPGAKAPYWLPKPHPIH